MHICKRKRIGRIRYLSSLLIHDFTGKVRIGEETEIYGWAAILPPTMSSRPLLSVLFSGRTRLILESIAEYQYQPFLQSLNLSDHCLSTRAYKHFFRESALRTFQFPICNRRKSTRHLTTACLSPFKTTSPSNPMFSFVFKTTGIFQIFSIKWSIHACR